MLKSLVQTGGGVPGSSVVSGSSISHTPLLSLKVTQSQRMFQNHSQSSKNTKPNGLQGRWNVFKHGEDTKKGP